MNRLQDATSPYLLQHAGNPVHWWPWCPEALDTARRHDRPILLSIGYSACHWCHVMAHESFDDAELAEKMNRGFVNIKVDREQRPDLDRIYQLAHQVLTDRAGGWPLTVFLDPHSRLPFFAGTYFPPNGRPGLPGFGELLDRISDYWKNRRDEIQTNTDNLHDYLEGIGSSRCSDDALTGEPGLQALTVLERQYDEVHGGFGAAPKFPATGSLRFLMEWSGFNSAQRDHADEMIQLSLAKMAAGGLYDQLEGGFFRYSVDPQWAIPHFEKMTSDNALLLWLYARAARRWQREDFAATARELAQWIMQNLQDPAGGYHSSWDADSDGKEGLWYLWTRDQFEAALSEDEAMLASRHWGLDGPPNYDGQAWHLVQARGINEVARSAGVGRSLARDCIHNARKKLVRVRRERPPPGRDDKVLTGWNGLMIGAMATAARLLDAPDMLRSAHRALADVQARLWVDGRLLACARGEQAELPAYLDDYAYLLDATLELLTTAWRPADLQFARSLADALLVHFEDPEEGGFYFTSHDHEALPQRAKPMADEATPSGNAVAARSLLRLGRLVADPKLESAAERVLRNAWSDLQRAPQVCGAMLGALDEWLNPPRQIVLRGERSELREVWQALADRIGVRDQVFALDPGSLHERFPRAGEFSAYLCQGHQCSAPAMSPAELLAMLEAGAD